MAVRCSRPIMGRSIVSLLLRVKLMLASGPRQSNVIKEDRIKWGCPDLLGFVWKGDFFMSQKWLGRSVADLRSGRLQAVGAAEIPPLQISFEQVAKTMKLLTLLKVCRQVGLKVCDAEE